MKSAPSSAMRHRLDAQADALHALDVDAAGDLFGERRQAFLRGGGARRGQRQALQLRLLAAVERGERVHEGLVLQQLVAVVVAEGGAVRRRMRVAPAAALAIRSGSSTTSIMRASKKSSSAACSCNCSAVGGDRHAVRPAPAVRWSSSLAMSMKWCAASRVVGPSPGSGSSGRPNRRIECVRDLAACRALRAARRRCDQLRAESQT